MARKGIRKSGGLLGDVLRKVQPLSGVAEIRMPSDIRRVIVQNIEKVRESAVDVFAKEISKVLAKIDVKNIVDDVLHNYSLRVEARIDLTPKYHGEPAARHPGESAARHPGATTARSEKAPARPRKGSQ